MSALVPLSPPDRDNKTHYQPFTATVGKTSQYRPGIEFELLEITETLPNGKVVTTYWNWPQKAPRPTEGNRYQIFATTKPKGGRARPGSVYRDVVRAEPIVGENDQEYVDVSDPPAPTREDEVWGDAPAGDKESVDVVEKPSPLALKAVPPEWGMPIEYWLHKQAAERLSIETQTALKAAVETYGFMLANPGSVSDVETTRFLNAIQELVARLGRITWPDVEVEKNETP